MLVLSTVGPQYQLITGDSYGIPTMIFAIKVLQRQEWRMAAVEEGIKERRTD